jgi:hypothetical protein
MNIASESIEIALAIDKASPTNGMPIAVIDFADWVDYLAARLRQRD